MANVVIVKSGRKWKRARDGASNTISVRYQVKLDGSVAVGSEGLLIDGIPEPGDEHPTYPKLTVESVDYEEESQVGFEKILNVTVNYSRKVSELAATTQETGGEKYQVDEWGWDSATEEKELLQDVEDSTKPVLNSVGDPFDSVPKVSAYSPVFTKQMKFATRQSVHDYNCKVNSSEMTVGGMTCAEGTLLCSVSEKRIFGDPDWNYSYSVQLRYKSNTVKIYGDDETSELGWDVAIADSGMRVLDPADSSGKRKVIIRVVDEETRQECPVTSPVLLDGNGNQISPTDSDQGPRFLRFKAYARTSFPSWFTSEPPIQHDESSSSSSDS